MTGFNSGMGSRDIWKPKDVDELRVKTNPKMSYNLNGLEGPAISNIKEMGTLEKLKNMHLIHSLLMINQDGL